MEAYQFFFLNLSPIVVFNFRAIKPVTAAAETFIQKIINYIVYISFIGVRYNAEKKKVGNYYTTPIYRFRMKCHLCDNHFEIETDPKVSKRYMYYKVTAMKELRIKKNLKWYYDQKIISFFSSDFESVFTKHPTGKILSFVFYPKAVYFECKFWTSRSAIAQVQNWPIGHQRIGSRENDVIYSLA